MAPSWLNTAAFSPVPPQSTVRVCARVRVPMRSPWHGDRSLGAATVVQCRALAKRSASYPPGTVRVDAPPGRRALPVSYYAPGPRTCRSNSLFTAPPLFVFRLLRRRLGSTVERTWTEGERHVAGGDGDAICHGDRCGRIHREPSRRAAAGRRLARARH